jgi:transcriptional regulator with XRE-family HTH domain
MLTNPTAKTIRTKKLGVLIRDARLFSSRSLVDCAQVLGISPAVFEAYELGEQAPSLPELEMLAYYFGVPLEHFYGNHLLEKDHHLKVGVTPEVLLGLRQRMVGVLIRKRRKEAGFSLAELAETAGINAKDLESYELGLKPAPVPDLDALAFALHCTVKDFQDQHGPVGTWFTQQYVLKDFQSLSPELQAFISKPVNRPYLEMAQRLSELSVDKLRMVAEVLLEITL